MLGSLSLPAPVIHDVTIEMNKQSTELSHEYERDVPGLTMGIDWFMYMIKCLSHDPFLVNVHKGSLH